MEKSIKSSGNSSTTCPQCLKYVKSLLSMFERKSFNLFLKPFTLLIKSDISFLIFFLLLIFASRAAKRSLRAACGPRAVSLTCLLYRVGTMYPRPIHKAA
uniref:Uncharacterized protein n=1 Tax=Cacopsylla melanoneura TaxID=428564 RepID=A0A8D8XFX6_9HEMI